MEVAILLGAVALLSLVVEVVVVGGRSKSCLARGCCCSCSGITSCSRLEVRDELPPVPLVGGGTLSFLPRPTWPGAVEDRRGLLAEVVDSLPLEVVTC